MLRRIVCHIVAFANCCKTLVRGQVLLLPVAVGWKGYCLCNFDMLQVGTLMISDHDVHPLTQAATQPCQGTAMCSHAEVKMEASLVRNLAGGIQLGGVGMCWSGTQPYSTCCHWIGSDTAEGAVQLWRNGTTPNAQPICTLQPIKVLSSFAMSQLDMNVSYKLR